MARFNPRRDTNPVLDAAAEWRDLCLLADGSALSPSQAIWTPANIARLHAVFTENPDTSSASFIAKLRGQLQNDSPLIVQLAAEMMWAMLLFPSNITPAKKRENVEAILAWSPTGNEVRRDLLADPVMSGIGSAGVAYNTYRPLEFEYMLSFAMAVKALGEADRAQLFADPWRFSKFLRGIPGDNARGLAHILQYLLFPDTFERVASGEDKRNIIVGLGGDDPRVVSQFDRAQRDRRLLEIRDAIAATRGNSNFDFYEPEFAERWNSATGVFEGISAADIDLLRQSRRHEKYAQLSSDELKAYHRIHKALGQLGSEVVEALGGEAEYKCRLTSGYTTKSGVRGSLPKDLWFGVYAVANEDAFVGHPQLFMIVSERGLEFGFAALTHPSDFSNQLVKDKVREAAPSVFNLLPAPGSPLAEALGQRLDSEPGWTYRRKERLAPHETDFAGLTEWLSSLRNMTDFKNAGGNISNYLTASEIEGEDLIERMRSMAATFKPLMEEIRAGAKAGFVAPASSTATMHETFNAICTRAIDQLAVAREKPFETVPNLWDTMHSLIDRLAAFDAMQIRPHVFAKWSLGKGVWAKVPWIALMNRNLTTSTQEGLYVVFLVAEDLSRIYLTLNQGMTKLVNSLGEATAVATLRDRAGAYRALVPELAGAGFTLSDAIDLKTDNWRAKNYQPSTIAYAELEIGKLPTDDQLESMLEALLAAYDRLAQTIDQEPETMTEDALETDAEAAPFSMDDVMKQLFIEQAEFERILEVWRRKKNMVLQGAPGVGKSYIARFLAYALMDRLDDSRIENIQFHQSYSYEDFVQGFRPTATGFELRDGVFYRFCKKAAADLERPHVFIIDELNRGNLSKIFGELMLLIEHDKRDPKYGTQLAYARDGEPKFYVPKNVYVIGMMNTADRSLSMVDYALRRRFAFITLDPAFDSPKFRTLLSDLAVSQTITDRIVARMTLLNQAIGDDTINLGHGYRIGHSFFVPDGPVDDDHAWYQRVIATEIAPLLEEYWFDDRDNALSWGEKLTAPS